MADQTPAEELRAAAARLRCEHTHPVLPPHSLWAPGPCGRCGELFDGDVVPEALRGPLAALLDHYAERCAYFAGLGEKALFLFPAEYELAVARVILGGDRG